MLRWETELADLIKISLYSGWLYLTTYGKFLSCLFLQYVKALTITCALISQWFSGSSSSSSSSSGFYGSRQSEVALLPSMGLAP